jgi:hypothetical protein
MNADEITFALESPLNGWRLRLRTRENTYEIRMVTADRTGTLTLRRYPHPTLDAALQDLQDRFLTRSLADARVEWDKVRAAFIVMRTGRPGIRPGRQPLRAGLGEAIDPLMASRLVVVEGIAALLAKARAHGVVLSQRELPFWVELLLQGVQSQRSSDLLKQDQLARISETLLGKCPL